MSCDEGAVLVLWTATGYRGRAVERRVLETPAHAQALAIFHAEPLAPLLAPARGWEPTDPERIFDGRELAAWPLPAGWTEPPRGRAFPGRARVVAEPLRAPGVALPPGVSLAAALAGLPGLAERKALAKAAGEVRRRVAEKGRAT